MSANVVVIIKNSGETYLKVKGVSLSMKKLEYYKLLAKNKLPKFLKYRRQFIKHPFNKILNTGNSNINPEEWEESGFLCLCCNHIQEFNSEDHVDAGPTLGYYVCDKKGCKKTATHELMPNLKSSIENAAKELK